MLPVQSEQRAVTLNLFLMKCSADTHLHTLVHTHTQLFPKFFDFSWKWHACQRPKWTKYTTYLLGWKYTY